MTFTRDERRLPVPPTVGRSVERRQLSRLAGALTRYGVWARVIEDRSPFLRVSNPKSMYAAEDIFCEPRKRHYAFCTSFGVDLGTSEDMSTTAERVARLVGARPR